MYVCMYVCMSLYIIKRETYIHTYIHTYIRTYMHTYIHTLKCVAWLGGSSAHWVGAIVHPMGHRTLPHRSCHHLRDGVTAPRFLILGAPRDICVALQTETARCWWNPHPVRVRFRLRCAGDLWHCQPTASSDKRSYIADPCCAIQRHPNPSCTD